MIKKYSHLTVYYHNIKMEEKIESSIEFYSYDMKILSIRLVRFYDGYTRSEIITDFHKVSKTTTRHQIIAQQYFSKVHDFGAKELGKTFAVFESAKTLQDLKFNISFKI